MLNTDLKELKASTLLNLSAYICTFVLVKQVLESQYLYFCTQRPERAEGKHAPQGAPCQQRKQPGLELALSR